MIPFRAIGISGINATDNPGPGVPVAKCLRSANTASRLIGLGYEPHDPGHYLRGYFDDSALMTLPGQGWETFRSRLLALRDRFGIDAVIPCLDAELPLYIRFADELAREGIATCLPTEEQFRLRNKENLTALAPLIGARHPATFRAGSLAELETAWAECPKPAFVKGPYYKAYPARTRDEAFAIACSLADEWGWPILVQETVQGEELNVVGVGDGEGGHLGLVSIKKLTTTSLGKIWTGVTIARPELRDVCERFIRHTKWRGPFELECIASENGVTLIEINPRFPAWVGFSAGVDVNLPERLVTMMRGGDPRRDDDPPVGRLFVRYTDDLVTDMEHFQKIIAR